MRRSLRMLFVLVVALLFIGEQLEAQRRGGGGFRGGGGRGMGSRGAARASVNARPSFARASSRPSFNRPDRADRARPDRRPERTFGTNGADRPDRIARPDRPVQPDRVRPDRPNRPDRIDRNVNIDREINVDREIHIDGDGGWWDWDDGCCFHRHPIARAAAWGAAAAAYNSAYYDPYVYTLPYDDCVVEVVNGITYQRCGDDWYQPQFEGTDAVYVAVASP